MKYFPPFFFFCFLFLGGIAFSYSLENQNEEFYYIHFKRSSGEITGYSKTIFQILPNQENPQKLREKTSLYNKKNEVFSEVENTYQFPNFHILQSKIKEHRKDILIETEFGKKKMVSSVRSPKEEKKYTHSIDSKEKIFEELFFFFIQNLPQIEAGKLKKLTIFFPQIFFDLESKNLPTSLSSLNFNIKSKQKRDCYFGGEKYQCRLIELTPSSFFLKAILPKNRTRYTFLIGKQKNARRIFEFDDGETLYSLSSQAPYLK